MGFFSSQPAGDKRASEVRSGAVAPDRSERARCWEARDAYFTCLDKASIVDPIKEDKAARSACSSETSKFEQDCATSWVKYFKQWRVADIQKKAQIAKLEAEGAVRMDVTPSFDAGNGTAIPATSGVPKGTSRQDALQMLSKQK